ncbi:phage tail tube protein [Halalkalibacter alkalisediminis]|uniref:Phage tail tube protein n=1 Tax=Halalkalibacter alkalisediminis TaxID=935616 RepID=A0ABV6NGX1_9BACI|nr:phage major tail protein, TP901-1 family [Halalkalibacter alkalisediminis]
MAKKVQGVKCKVYIVESLDELDRKVLGGQRSATLNRSAETLDATSKDSAGGWKENEAGFKEWSVDTDGLLIQSDEAYDLLEERFNNSEKVGVIIELPNGKTYEGMSVITDFPIDLPYDDLVTYTAAFTGDGELAKVATAPTGE